MSIRSCTYIYDSRSISDRRRKIWSGCIETQGGAGIDNELTPEDIKEAVCVILSSDIAIEGEERFHGKKVMRMGIQDLMKKADPVIKKIKETFK